jgi:ribosomal protein S18 acetylase RimI-like enzyme
MFEIAQNYRHQGVGTSLLHEIIRYCRDRNIQRLTGEIKADNTTVRLWYRHRGFRVCHDDRIEISPATCPSLHPSSQGGMVKPE